MKRFGSHNFRNLVDARKFQCVKIEVHIYKRIGIGNGRRMMMWKHASNLFMLVYKNIITNAKEGDK